MLRFVFEFHTVSCIFDFNDSPDKNNSMKVPTETEVEQITNIADPVMRNLRITQCYYELSRAMAELTGAHPNWCTFATWASKQAGQTIRSEDLIRTFEIRFRQVLSSTGITRTLAKLLAAWKRTPAHDELNESLLRMLSSNPAFLLAGENVALGNRIVFEEIGREFARFLQVFRTHSDFTPERIESFCDGLNPGDPPDGQRLLREAFRVYYELRSTTDPKSRTELMLFANLLIGYHEQIRLQPQIVAALDAPLSEMQELQSRIQRILFPGIWLRVRYFISRLLRRSLPLDDAIDRLLNLAGSHSRESITGLLMTIFIPENEIIRLGKDIRLAFPPPLQIIVYPQLIDLLTRIDPTPDSTESSGAKDWGIFTDRMHFIADLFRAYHMHLPIGNAPFTTEQTEMLNSGRFPAGRL